MNFVKKVWGVVGLLAFVCLISYAQDVTAQKDAAQIGKDATVIIVVRTDDGVVGSGSGFFIRQDLIATNIHVLAGIHAKPITCSVKLVNQPIEYTIKGVMASDPEHDLVILKIDGESKYVLTLGDSDFVELDEEVFAMGTHRNNVPGKIVKGTISRITPYFFRMKTAFPPGYSGGPVLNDAGKVVGICVESSKIINSGYIIPSNYLGTLLKQVSTQENRLVKWQMEPLIRAYGMVNHGNERIMIGNTKEAIEAYDVAIRLMPDFTAAYAKRGSAKYYLKDYKGAVKDLDVCIHLGHDHSVVYSNRGLAQKNLRNYKEASKDFDEAIYLGPENAVAFLNRGNIRSDLGDYKMAIEDYDAVIRLKPKNNLLAIAHYNNGLAKLNLGDAESAIKYIDEAIRLKLENDILFNAHTLRAKAKYELGDIIGAIEDYDAAIRLSSKNTVNVAFAHSKRASVKLDISDNKGAIEDCNITIQLDPNLVDAYKIRGDAKFNLQNYEEAIKDYDTAIYLQPDYIIAYYQRGNAKVEIGKVSEAKIDFRTALKFAKSESSQSIKDEIEKAFRLIK